MGYLIVTDLDDTIYDWLGFYVPSFKAMLSEIERISGVPMEELIRAFRKVHQRHGTTEYGFSIQELEVLPPANSPEALRVRLDRFAPAIRAFRETRKKLLRPHRSVRETLETLVSNGVTLVAHSDSLMQDVTRRLRLLDLDEFFAAIYAPKHRSFGSAAPGSISDALPGARTEYRPLPTGSRKPDPKVLTMIAMDLGYPIERTIYVGDSLSRDIQMAQRAGAIGVWARYGAHEAGENLEFLKSISYWSDEEMAGAEGAALVSDQPRPRFIIDTFSQLLDVLATLDVGHSDGVTTS